MSAYRLKFLPRVLIEWEALDGSVKSVLKKLLKKRLDQPHVAGAQLHGGLTHCYKIKLLKQGYRLVYLVEDDILVAWCWQWQSENTTPFTDRPSSA